MRLRPLAGLLVLALALTGCGGASDAATPAPSDTGPADRVEPLDGVPEPELPVTVASADGTSVTLTSVDAIVPLSGSLSEIVFTLGLGGRVVARDITATFEQAADLPVVTRGHDVSAEGVLSLRPGVVLAEKSSGPAEAIAQIRSAGIPVVVFEGATGLSSVDKRIADVAAALGVPEAGERLRARTAERIAAVQATIPVSPDRPRVAFLYVRGSASVYLIGATDSGAAGLIEAAGAIDAGKEAGLEGDFVPITSEAMAAAAPDVILVMTKGLESVDGVDGLLALPGVAQTPAGMDRRVAVIDDGVLLNYGPRTDQVLASLVAQIHAGA
ncbi:heme/hemin ABC transporter substrate-binding protein [Phytomonospora endophytica]|uniref:Iron complex transport system substrate-binding protein n=1 Tax=Phytomonospora endophytica TaxID=714109 RepID=A0A841FW93_9ACTN|nr:ABC transporter substrate-binding protein [Phytomonospora endophytica]MBB6036250.1 iron complex transport system substrate-binding protein [Phytomonospora endophytica]GIG67157.1 ABC transporter substrate-binding protein [Phytomonospora endophytica]